MRRLLLLVSVAAFAILSNPARAQFCPGAAPWVFDDVPASDQFCGYITWAAQRGITLGCAIIDANHRLYCPADPVRRDQMAAFANRLGNQSYLQGGSAFGATAVLGTTDNNAIDIRVNGARAMRLEPTGGGTPNVIGGHPNNAAAPFLGGQTIAGGGVAGTTCFDPPTGTNTRSCANLTNSLYATVSGGYSNQSNHFWSTVSGGAGNTASGSLSVVAGGYQNIASGTNSTVVGGFHNVASGMGSLAAGTSARTQTAGGTPTIHDGAFVWADGTAFDFNTQASHEFAARATGGVRFVTAIDGVGNPARTVKINPNGELEFGNQVRQMLNLYGPAVYGIGVQASTLYARSDSNFAWFMDGVHADNTYDPGAGGLVLATLQPGASATAVFGVFRAQVLTQTSDKDAKSDFAAADPSGILAKVVSMPIAIWTYKSERQDGTRHIGPTAQDFKERFGVGYDDKTIATVDADGVALAAIQGLNAKVETQAREIAELRRALEVLMARVSAEGRLAAR